VIRVTASTEIAAPASVPYGIISDYTQGHPSILPPEFFADLAVEAGGRGAGTRIRFTMISYGRRVVSRAEVTEPEPGRVLVETDQTTGITTRFIVDPVSADTCRVTFETDYPARGFRGLFERLLVPPYLKKVYAAELELLSQRAVETARGAGRTGR
jgi:hypothetical protein